MAITSLEGGNN